MLVCQMPVAVPQAVKSYLTAPMAKPETIYRWNV